MKNPFIQIRTRKDPKTVALDFLKGEGKNAHGKQLSDIWGYTVWQLENDHTYIQWIFPLDTPSEFNSLAPVICKDDIKQLSSANLALIQTNMLQSLSVMLRFYGFDYTKYGQPGIICRHNFQNKKRNWCVLNNHNHLRITRILKSLKLFELDRYADAFYQALIDAEADERVVTCKLGYLVNPRTLQFWADAVGKESVIETKEGSGMKKNYLWEMHPDTIFEAKRMTNGKVVRGQVVGEEPFVYILTQDNLNSSTFSEETPKDQCQGYLNLIRVIGSSVKKVDRFARQTIPEDKNNTDFGVGDIIRGKCHDGFAFDGRIFRIDIDKEGDQLHPVMYVSQLKETNVDPFGHVAVRIENITELEILKLKEET